MIKPELLQAFPTKRIKAIDGMSVTADVWEDAHAYHRQQQRFHALFGHGPGIVAAGVGLASGEFVFWPFIATQSVLLGLWIFANAVLIKDWIGGKPFDPYPFILLNLVLSFQAAYTGPVVMMSQNRQSAMDRDEAEHDYEVDREAITRLDRLDERLARIEAALGRAPS